MTTLLSTTILLALSLPPQVDSRAEAIAPFVGEETVAVVHLDLENLNLKEIILEVAGEGVPENEIDDAARDLRDWLDALRKGGAKDFYLLIDPADLPEMPVAIVPLTEGADAEAIGRVLSGDGELKPLFSWPTSATVKEAVFAGTDAALERVRKPNPSPRPEFAEAFAAAGQSPAQIVIAPSATQRRVFEEMVPNLPEPLGGAPITTITRGVSWAFLSLESQPKPVLRAVIQSPDPDAAEALNKLAKTWLDLARQAFQNDESDRMTAEALNQVQARVAGDRLVLTIDLKQVSAHVPIREARMAAQRAQCRSHLKMIAVAMHNYIDRHKTFPPAYSQDADGKPLLSWRVHILPLIEQQALYDEFHLDEPWDSPHNKPLIDKMPDIYHCPSTPSRLKTNGQTTYLVPRGEATIFPGAEGVTLKGITDGTSNTIILIDAGDDHAVTWTKPEDWELGEEIDPSVLFGDQHESGTNTAFADGSVHFLKKSIAPKILKALMTRNGGEVISYEDY